MDRQLEHCVFHRGLETHTRWGPNTPFEAELMIKASALFCRGIIVSDSDLNNLRVFNLMTHSGHDQVLEDALGHGFFLRAARETNDHLKTRKGPLTQQELFEDFAKNSPERAAKITKNHPRWLDEILSRVERDTPPLTWSLRSLAEIFGYRLVTELSYNCLDVEERRIAEKIIDYVLSFGENISELRGAIIEKKFLPNWREDPLQKRIWGLVLQAYNGNVPYAFGGRLILAEPTNGDISIIPGGPEASEDDRRLAEDYYVSLLSNTTEQLFSLGEMKVSPSPLEASTWYLDLEKLLNLRLPEIEELRESASPDRYFYLRYRALGSSESPSTGLKALYEARQEFWEALERSGIALTRSAEDAAKQDFYRYYLKRRLEQERGSIVVEGGKLAAQTFAEITRTGWIILLTDCLSLWEGMRTFNKAQQEEGVLADRILSEASRLYDYGWSQKRPDYSIIKRIYRRIAAGDTCSPSSDDNGSS